MRWFTIKIYKTGRREYVWADRAGWGPGVFTTWLGALWWALRGGW